MTNNNIHTEKELLLLISNGDETAFRALFHIYGPLIRNVILQIIKLEAPVEDMLQDIFLKVWLNREKLPELNNPRSWVIRIAYHQSFNWLRHQKIRESKNIAAPAAVLDVEESVQFAETSRLIQQALHNLNDQSRSIYIMSRENGMKLSDIAETLGISVQTVKNTISRTLKSIREHLEQNGIVLPFLVVWYWPL